MFNPNLNRKEMKLSNFFIGALVCLGLLSCSKDLEQPIVDVAPLTKTVEVDLTVSSSDNDLRIAYQRDEQTGRLVDLAMSDKNLNIRIAVKRGDGVPVAQTLEFKKIEGPYARYQGPIEIPSGGSGDYKISGILLSEVGEGGKEFMKVSDSDPNVVEMIPTPLTLEPSSGSQVEVNVPYVSRWHDITVAEGGTRVSPIELLFHPQGTVLRMQVQNESDTEFPLGGIRFLTNTFSAAGSFSFAQTTADQPTWSESDNIDAKTILYSLPAETKIPAKVGVTPGKSAWYYVWVMPRNEVVEPRTVVSMRSTDPVQMYIGFETEKPLPTGSVPVILNLPAGEIGAHFNLPQENSWDSPVEPKMPLAYLAEYNLNAEGTGFASHDNNDSGLFTIAETKTRFLKTTIDGKKYHLGTTDEWYGVVPASIARVTFVNTRITKDHIEIVRAGGMRRAYTSDYRSVAATKTVYAIRFQDPLDQSMRSAYRYKMIGTTAPGSDAYVEVKARYLGKDWSGDLVRDVAKDAFFEDPSVTYVTRRLPMSGTVNAGEVNKSLVGERGYYWHAPGLGWHQNSAFQWMTIVRGNNAGSGHTPESLQQKMAVRLFSDY